MFFGRCSNGENGGGISYQIYMTILTNIPLVSFGLTMGWLSPNSQYLQNPSDPTMEPLSDEVISWMAAGPFLAAIPAVFVFWYAVDVMGRKPALIWSSVPFVICWAMKLYSAEPWVLITARAFAGIGSSGCFIVSPLYVAEISQDSIRGALGSVLVLAQNLGYLLVYIMSDYLEYRTVLWGCLALALVNIVLFVFMPESPSFLISKDRIPEATETLAWLRKWSVQDKRLLEELAELQRREEEAMEMSKKESFVSIVADKTTFQAFRIAMILILAQEVCGLFTLLMFAGRIFEAAGAVGITSNQQTTILGAVQLAGSLLASFTVERIGRKHLLAATGYIISLCMLTLGIWFYLSSQGYQLPRWLPVLAMCLGIFCDSAGLQPVPYIILSELFTFELRGMVAAAVMGSTDLVNFTELKIFHPIVNNMGMHTCFWVFTVISFCFATYAVLFVPETMGKTVEEIYEELRGSKRKGLEDNAKGDLRESKVNKVCASENNNIKRYSIQDSNGIKCKGSNNRILESYWQISEEGIIVENYTKTNEGNELKCDIEKKRNTIKFSEEGETGLTDKDALNCDISNIALTKF